MTKIVFAGVLALAVLGAQAQQKSGDEIAQQAIPDAPAPQTKLPGLNTVAPGMGTTSSSGGDATAPNGGPDNVPPDNVTPAGKAPSDEAPPDQAPPEYLPGPGQAAKVQTLIVPVNFVQVPFTVKGPKNALVAGLTWRDVTVYENGVRQHISFFTPDPYPLSVALVIDQSMTHDNVDRVNNALGALQSAFSKYDEVAVFTYNNGPKMVTDFTGAQSARLTQALNDAKGSGRDAMLAGSLSGPLAQTTIVNNQNFDPNTAANRGHSSLDFNAPREVHTLNDAILAAATALSKAPRDRRRIIYVISDGKEYGSTAKTGQVIQYLQTNNIALSATLVGDSSLPVVGFLDGLHLPLMMRDNVLPTYTKATGGSYDAEFRTGGIERAFAQIIGQARDQYVLGYYTHEPFIDGKYRKIEVRVLRPNLTVLAKQGYYPSAVEARAPSLPGR